uniref:Uncharacterized protein n=1 Tax=Acrobeloides nanus TaxID=290746 RepID=A0A914DRT4_9BILA
MPKVRVPPYTILLLCAIIMSINMKPISLHFTYETPSFENGSFNNPTDCINLPTFQNFSYGDIISRCFGAKIDNKLISQEYYAIFTGVNSECQDPKNKCATVPYVTDGNKLTKLECKDDDGRNYKIIEWATASNQENGSVRIDIMFSMKKFVNEHNPRRIPYKFKMICSYWLYEAIQSLKNGKSVKSFRSKKVQYDRSSANETITSLLSEYDVIAQNKQRYDIFYFATSTGKLFQFIHENQKAVLLYQTHYGPIFDLNLQNDTLFYKTPFNKEQKFEEEKKKLPSTCSECVGLRHPRIGWISLMKKCVFLKNGESTQHLMQDLVSGTSYCDLLYETKSVETNKSKPIEAKKEKSDSDHIVYQRWRIIGGHIRNYTKDYAQIPKKEAMEKKMNGEENEFKVLAIPWLGILLYFAIIGLLLNIVMAENNYFGMKYRSEGHGLDLL